MSAKIQKVNSKIESIQNKYNAEFDVLPNHPIVSSTDMELLEIIKLLQLQIMDLQEEINQLKRKGD